MFSGANHFWVCSKLNEEYEVTFEATATFSTTSTTWYFVHNFHFYPQTRLLFLLCLLEKYSYPFVKPPYIRMLISSDVWISIQMASISYDPLALGGWIFFCGCMSRWGWCFIVLLRAKDSLWAHSSQLWEVSWLSFYGEVESNNFESNRSSLIRFKYFICRAIRSCVLLTCFSIWSLAHSNQYLM